LFAEYKILFFDGTRIPLANRRNIVLGDTKVVNLIEDWAVLEEYAGEKLGFYQILAVDGNIEIRVMTGRLGFKKEFKDGNDKQLNQILDFCKKSHFIQISEHLRDEDFFK